MYKNILIPTDGSELSRKAVEHGVLLARALKARVTSITVMSLSQIFDFEPASFTKLPEEWGYKKLAEKFANKCLDQVKTAALAPIPRVRQRTAKIEKPGLRRSSRKPKRKS
jgi:nucleotide-binding universal stress UspA family protein